jgi:nitroreductase
MLPDRLTMPIGQVMLTQRSVRKFKPDAIPAETLHLLMEAAVRAPNGGNHQTGRFLLVTDRDKIREFAKLYHEAWWAKRRDEKGWTKKEDIPATEKNYTMASELADSIGDVPLIAFAFTTPGGGANSVIPACQNLMLAAHALGIGSIPTTLHKQVMERFQELFGIPRDQTFHFCIPMGYPAVAYGLSKRRPTSETTYLDRWGQKVPWA